MTNKKKHLIEIVFYVMNEVDFEYENEREVKQFESNLTERRNKRRHGKKREKENCTFLKFIVNKMILFLFLLQRN